MCLFKNRGCQNFFVKNPLPFNAVCNIFEVYFSAVSTSKNVFVLKSSSPLHDH